MQQQSSPESITITARKLALETTNNRDRMNAPTMFSRAYRWLNIWGSGPPAAPFAPIPRLNIWGSGPPTAPFAPIPWFTLAVMLVGMTCNDGSTSEMNVANRFAVAAPPVSLVTVKETKIVAPNGKPSDLFGFSMAMSGDTIIMGTPYEDSVAQDAGAAYVFVRTNGVWTFEQKFVAPDFGAGGWFGYAVAIDGNKAIIGAPRANGNTLGAGATYVFLRTNGMWIALPKLSATDGKPGDMFGQSVDISGTSIIMGCPNSDAKGLDAGAAYVFVWNGSVYIEQKKLFPADFKAEDHFGFSVAMNGETAIVGAPDAGRIRCGFGHSIHIFPRGNALESAEKTDQSKRRSRRRVWRVRRHRIGYRDCRIASRR